MDSVFFINAKLEKGKGGLSQKYLTLLKTSGIQNIVKKGKKAAIKLHMGERGNVRYIRPYFVRITVDLIKELSGIPFVFDTTVIYPGKRETAKDYIETAKMNGFSEETINCPIIIADNPADGVKLIVKNPLRLKEVIVSRNLIEADILINLSHFTFHPQFPFAAGVKNLGMGCALKETKDAMHTIKGTKPRDLGLWEATIDTAKTIIEKFEDNAIHINFLIDITEDCDCFSKSNIPIFPDLGILASRNIFALDFASYELVSKSTGYPGSKFEGKKPEDDPLEYLNKKELSYKIYREVIKRAIGFDVSYKIISPL